ncbi:TerD family protein [Helicobacter ailurogastricus]|uniref:Tellurium resistance protein TerD n=1 Tax=Helicobacter ailurogastricus TaxID=1578720 RepID=A0A0K2Y4B3_9HELI|nr:TerD family protein [Helicobacter ailurogastricus]CRF41055.1 Tellurium resistance protein TerD [Helicobacter ailurogastricus]CRF42343.1 Tellurium resistance protein TerD [Helicobacter ailurogastricus]CRF44759.1 Tellurium resistance protein TerD [Helicobacter ailurogastricus]CRF51970.1 Tellurium resistance protein TerD [Helicobacter ailurogastricus]BDQ29082.1 chemical-damaging agent resistance protein C [Helicobacter ailurogastricus]
MSVSLVKGGRVSLSKEKPGLSKIVVGLGWDVNSTDTGADFDLDASVFLTDSSGKVSDDANFVFYNNPKSKDGAVVHTGDNRTGAGEGDDEQIKVALKQVDSGVQEIHIVVTIHEADTRKQNFGMVRHAFVRIVDESDNQEILRYDLEEDFSIETALMFGRLYRDGDDWKFAAVGTGFKEGLAGFCKQFGVNV